jgi:hypothetical protein
VDEEEKSALSRVVAHRSESKFTFDQMKVFLLVQLRHKQFFCIINHSLPEVSQLPSFENSMALTHP